MKSRNRNQVCTSCGHSTPFITSDDVDVASDLTSRKCSRCEGDLVSQKTISLRDAQEWFVSGGRTWRHDADSSVIRCVGEALGGDARVQHSAAAMEVEAHITHMLNEAAVAPVKALPASDQYCSQPWRPHASTVRTQFDFYRHLAPKARLGDAEGDLSSDKGQFVHDCVSEAANQRYLKFQFFMIYFFPSHIFFFHPI